MTKDILINQIRQKNSFLCIGLDVDLDKIPPHLLRLEDPIFEFNKQIIEATHDLVVAYKPNTAFYEAYGIAGWRSLEKTINYLNERYPEIFTIADAKRGDIGNTSTRYAKAFFEQLNFDALTVAPYMGRDSVEPFLAFTDKFTILLALTSNKGGLDFQGLDAGNLQVFEQVLKKSTTWKGASQLMYVVGATKPEYFKKIRKIVPNSFLLVPGIGAQGGDLVSVCNNGMTEDIGLLINSSRAIIYAGNGSDFTKKVREKAIELQEKMKEILASKLNR
jgi:orotidine-5'-phosphate decarboxylase